MKNFYFILKSTLTGIVLYALIALIMAYVKITFFGSEHPHNMDEVLYFILLLAGGSIGATLGLAFSIARLKDYSMKRVMKSFAIGLLVCIPVCIVLLLDA